MLDTCGVYIIRCLPTGDLYVGGTKTSFAVRFAQHKATLRVGRNSCRRLQELCNLHGLDAFEFRPIKTLSPELVARYEREAILRLKPSMNSYGVRASDIVQAAEAAGVCYETVVYRRKKGLPELSGPYQNKKRCLVRGEWLTAAEIAAKYQLPLKLVSGRIYNGESGERVIRARYTNKTP